MQEAELEIIVAPARLELFSEEQNKELRRYFAKEVAEAIDLLDCQVVDLLDNHGHVSFETTHIVEDNSVLEALAIRAEIQIPAWENLNDLAEKVGTTDTTTETGKTMGKQTSEDIVRQCYR